MVACAWQPNYLFNRSACVTRVRGYFRRGLCCHDFMKTDLRIANNNYRCHARSADLQSALRR
jgi:hypothetical protein